MICNKCGSQVGEGQRYCQACGNDMMQVNNQPNYSQPAQQPMQPQQPVYNQYQQPVYNQGAYPYQPVQQKKKGNGCIIAIVVVLGIFLLIGGCTWYVVVKVGGGWEKFLENSDKIVCCSDAGGTWENDQCTTSNTEMRTKYDECVAQISNDNSDSNTASNSNVTSNEESNSNQPANVGTYQISGYTFNTPVGYTATQKTSSVLLTNGFKNINVNISTGSYENLKSNKTLLSSYFSNNGYTVTNIHTAAYNNVEFLCAETKSQGYVLVIAYAKLDTNNVIVVTTTNAANTTTADYSLLADIATSIRTARKS